MPKWTEYTSKDTLADNDEVMLYDATAKANKRGLMSKFWDYVVDKMATAVISKLETDNKTIIGALNALNGKTRSIFLNADTDRTDIEKRKEAINALINQMDLQKLTNTLGVVRYYKGYYYSYIITAWSASGAIANVTVLEYSPYMSEAYIWFKDSNGELNVSKTINFS